MIWSFPLVTIVIRETCGSIVSATQSDSMLNTRDPRKAAETRLNTHELVLHKDGNRVDASLSLSFRVRRGVRPEASRSAPLRRGPIG